MSSRQNSALVTNTVNDCCCCSRCTSRIAKLEIMMNELFCYISDFLPEELDGFTQPPPPQEVYSPNKGHGNFGERRGMKKMPKGERNGTQKTKNIPKPLNEAKIAKAMNIITEDREKNPKRRQYSTEQKKDFVAKVQEGCRIGEKITDVCGRLGISDRSYQRWKRCLEQGQIGNDPHEYSEDDVIIQNPHL